MLRFGFEVKFRKWEETNRNTAKTDQKECRREQCEETDSGTRK
jgi:hypothetical protein